MRMPLKHDSTCIAPKIAVLVSDPRYAITIMWEAFTQCTHPNAPMTMPAYIEAFVENRLGFFGDYFAHAMAWAQEAAANPGTVRLFIAERFASCDAEEVKAACGEFAEFVNIPAPSVAAARLVIATTNPPAHAAIPLAHDCLPPPEPSGPLVELLGPRLESFEDNLAKLCDLVKASFRQQLFSWVDATDPCLVQLGLQATRGVSSLVPSKLMWPMKGEASHAAGQCRPCVFALRGICRNTADMCNYCHAQGHVRTKRANRTRRAERREVRARTPSPDGLSS